MVLIMFMWELWGRPDQLLPGGDWATWLLLAGRGWGKTRVGAETVVAEIEAGRAHRIALVAETAADARDVMVEGDSGILACSKPWNTPVYESSKRRVTWPNGAIAMTYNATEPNQLRGPQFDFAWCDELAKWRYAQETWDMLQFGLRLGRHPRQIITTTPRPIPIVKELVSDDTCIVTRGRTLDNADNLATSFLKRITKKYSGTRLGRQELDAEILDDMPGALWTREMIERAYISVSDELPVFERIVVAVDPSGSDDDEDASNDVGIVVAGKRGEHAYILGDYTSSKGPAGWASAAVRAYKSHGADLIVGERNFGGAMVKFTIRTIDPDVPFKEVVSSRGKFLRAEPVSALYEQNRVHHVGSYADLEDQMCAIGPTGYTGSGSPDRLDAMVFAVTELMLGSTPATPLFGVYGS